jgi:hypothetical protein
LKVLVVLIGVLSAALVGSPAVAAGLGSSSQSGLKVQIVVLDDATVKPLTKVKVGQLILISVKESSDDPQLDGDFFLTARVCIGGSPDSCQAAENFTNIDFPAESWKVRVEPSMVVTKRLSLYVTFNGSTVGQRAFPVASVPTGPPKVQWAKGPGLDRISICFSRGDLPSGFSAQMQVKHWWIGHPKAETHVYRFAFKPPTRLRAVMYRAVTSYTSLFDQDCLEIIPLTHRPGTRIGYFTFTYLYKSRKVSAANYKYSISSTQSHYANEGSDEFFNYCLKQHPETISQVGGVLRCFVPGDVLVVYRRI